jgi:V/A-type H+-transporting ATPase subunit A
VLQQDAFDEIDSVTPMERQKHILDMVTEVCRTEFEFDNFNKVADYFKELINIGRQMNYAEFKSEKFNDYYRQLQELVSQKSIN